MGSSPKRYAALWRIDGEMTDDLNKRLTYYLGADKGGWDITQVLRVPGTRNYKYGDAPLGRFLWSDGDDYRVEQLEAELPAVSTASRPSEADDIYKRYEAALKPETRRELLNGRPQVGKAQRRLLVAGP